MNPKGGKLGTCGLEGIKGSLAEPLEVDLEFNTRLGVLNLTSWGTKSQFVALRFTHDTRLKSQQSSSTPRILAFNAKSFKIPSLPKKASGRGAETKLFKLQQIDVKNTKNVQDVIHVPSHES